jgi:ABC-2 type transport system ATP-binding protein
VTVFLSSHLLGEVQQVCDHVAILAKGRCVASGRVADVLASRSSSAVRVRVADLDKGAELLREAGFAVRPAEGALHVDEVPDPSEVTRVLAERGLYLSELSPLGPDLETVFLELTEGPQIPAEAGQIPARAGSEGEAR